MNLNAFFRSMKFRVLLCILALLTGIMLYSVRSGGHTDRLTGFLQGITGPFRKTASGIHREVNERLDTYYNSKAYREENRRLREQNEILNKQLIGYDDAVRERDALRDQLGIKEKHEDFVLSEPCGVLMPTANDLTSEFQLNMGEADGLTLNAPVVCSAGTGSVNLIGVVTKLSPHYATVTTILSPELSVGAVVLETGDTGIAEGDLKYAADGNTKMIYLDENSSVEAHNLVITAGTTGLFPYGLTIGNVTETGMESTSLAKYAVIRPVIDFSELKTVSVLLDFAGKGESFGEK
ncbi:MAG: rod shape-determining protein MreC [Oscillospiraceae bacterium]|nr:rod shape-determining protein MreC [Oscillospiraceae bacterium]